VGVPVDVRQQAFETRLCSCHFGQDVGLVEHSPAGNSGDAAEDLDTTCADRAEIEIDASTYVWSLVT